MNREELIEALLKEYPTLERMMCEHLVEIDQSCRKYFEAKSSTPDDPPNSPESVPNAASARPSSPSRQVSDPTDGA